MSAITIGRMGLDITTPSLSSWQDNGDSVTIGAMNWTPGLEDGRALRQQLLGLATMPGVLVPLTSTDDPARDGFYAVQMVDMTSEALWKVQGHLSWQATLLRPPGFASMRPELTMSGGNRVTKPAGITALHWFGVPEGYAFGVDSGAQPGIRDRFLFDGTLMAIATGSSLIPRNTARLLGPMTNHYVGACTIRMGDPLRTVIGRQVAANVDAWEMSNGFVTVTPGTSASAIFTISVRGVNAGDVATVDHEIELGVDGPGFWSPTTDHTITSVSVTTDTVEETAIRISGRCNLRSASFPRNAFTVDLVLRRGALGVDMHMEFVEADTYGIGWVPAVPSTVIDVNATGFYATTPNADGMSPTIIHPADSIVGPWTEDLAVGRVFFPTFDINTADFWVGCADQATAASDAADLEAEYFSTLRARQRMVAA